MTAPHDADRAFVDDALLGAVRRLAGRTAEGATAADLADAISEELVGLLGANASAVYRLDGDEIVVVGGSTAPGWPVFVRGARFPIEPQMLVAEILQTGRPARAAAYDADPSDAARRVRALGYDVVVGAPIRVEGGLWGVVYAAANGADRLPSGVEQDLAVFADLCAIAVASLEQRARLEAQAIEQEALINVARLVLERAPEDVVFRAIARGAAGVVEAPAAALVTLTEDGAALVATWPDGAAMDDRDVETVARIAREGGTAARDDPDVTARHDDRKLLGRDVWWVASIATSERKWGAIVVAADTGTPIPPDAARRIARCAEICSIAIASVEARRDLVGQLTETERLAEEVEALAAGRRFLLVEALRSEERMRRQIADALHDDVLQELYAARLDLDQLGDDPEAGPRALTAVEAATRRVRDAVGDLHPAAASAHGLEDRLRSVLEQGGQRAGFGYRLTCDPAAPSELDDLVLTLLREFVHNAVKHAEATFLVVKVCDEHGELVIDVSDDGRGMAPDRPAEALRSGHIGLASSRERVEAVGGRLDVESAPGNGVHLHVRLPRGAAAG